MKITRIVSFLAFTVCVSLVAACASQSASEDKTEKYSGFLGDYSALKETTDTTGEKLMRYVSPKLKPGTYQAVMIDPVEYYPTPTPSDEVSAATLDEIRQYVEKGLRDKLGAKVTLASQPGPGVLRMRPAITAVAPQTAGLKPYQYIPVAFIITSAKGRGKEAALNMEVEVVDSATGERMGASVRKGVGAKLGKDAKLNLKDVKPLLDRWIDTGASFVASEIQ